MGSGKGIYLPNLNALRCIAASLVVLHHVEQVSFLNGWINFWHIPFVESVGNTAVNLFFVLSGYLITYLLMQEREQTQTISILDFYIRRTLRIWPLYFLIVGTGLFVWPHLEIMKLANIGNQLLDQHFWEAVVMFVFFLPNYFLNYFGAVPHMAQVWSIGIEEQFYLIWPWIISRSKNVLRTVFLFILLFNLLRIALKLGGHFHLVDGKFYVPPLTCLAIGGFFSLLHYYKDRNVLYHWLLKVPFQWATLLLILTLVALGYYQPFIHQEMYAFFFGILVLQASSGKWILHLEREPFLFLGRISYGLYMYHPILLVLTINLLIRAGMESRWLLYALTYGSTVLVAWLSYRFVEEPFIRKKLAFTKILSGDFARPESEKS